MFKSELVDSCVIYINISSIYLPSVNCRNKLLKRYLLDDITEQYRHNIGSFPYNRIFSTQLNLYKKLSRATTTRTVIWVTEKVNQTYIDWQEGFTLSIKIEDDSIDCS